MKEKRIVSTLLSLIICLTLLIGAFPVYGERLEAPSNYEEDMLFIMDVLDFVKAKYPFEVEDEDLVNNAVKGILQGLDPYSDYYTKEEVDQLLAGIYGDYVGIGVYIQDKDEYIEVVETIKDGPAEKEGLKAGDLIISIDDKSVKDITLNEATNLIQGIEGTKVKLGILRKESTTPIYINITREKIDLNPVEYKVLEGNIGYIKLTDFNAYATKYTKEALDEFDKNNITKVIVDVRDNPGGLLDQAINISRLFVPKGPVVHIQERNEPARTYYSTLQEKKYQLTVLVNQNSASASEIFAGAVQDTKAGTIIGTTTYGKGLVQSLYPLEDGSLIKLTIAQYLTPKKHNIHNKGIQPDIPLENKDQQLQKAINLLKSN